MMPTNSHRRECFRNHVVWGMTSVFVCFGFFFLLPGWRLSIRPGCLMLKDTDYYGYWVTKRQTRTGQQQTSGRSTTPPNDSIARDLDTREGWREQSEGKNAKELRGLTGTPKRLEGEKRQWDEKTLDGNVSWGKVCIHVHSIMLF